MIGALIAVVLLVGLMSYFNRRSLNQPDEAPTNAPAAAPAPAAETPPPPAPAVSAQGPVVLTATGPAWIQVTDHGKPG